MSAPRRGEPEMPMAIANGISINYRVGGQGEPLIMISGLGANQGAWRFQTGFFKKYYRTITFDNRDVGKSDKPAGDYTTSMMADDTVGLMGQLGIEKAHVLGHSMGGMIAQESARARSFQIRKRQKKTAPICAIGDSLGAWNGIQKGLRISP